MQASLRSSSPRERGVLYHCPSCRHLQPHHETCTQCGLPVSELTVLVRGLADLDPGVERGLLRYPGDTVTIGVAAVLLLCFPCGFVIGLSTDASSASAVAACLVGACLIGLPMLAFVDAHRAGKARPSEPALPSVTALVPRAWTAAEMRSAEVVRGVVKRVELLVSTTVIERDCVAAAVDIRAGKEAELVARRIESAAFVVSSASGAEILVTGTVELDGSIYRGVASTNQAALDIDGCEVLPASFYQGAWACELTVEDGDEVEVLGVPSGEEYVPQHGAHYRRAARIPVWRGTPGHPVTVRLLALTSAPKGKEDGKKEAKRGSEQASKVGGKPSSNKEFVLRMKPSPWGPN